MDKQRETWYIYHILLTLEINQGFWKFGVSFWIFKDLKSCVFLVNEWFIILLWKDSLPFPSKYWNEIFYVYIKEISLELEQGFNNWLKLIQPFFLIGEDHYIKKKGNYYNA